MITSSLLVCLLSSSPILTMNVIRDSEQTAQLLNTVDKGASLNAPHLNLDLSLGLPSTNSIGDSVTPEAKSLDHETAVPVHTSKRPKSDGVRASVPPTTNNFAWPDQLFPKAQKFETEIPARGNAEEPVTNIQSEPPPSHHAQVHSVRPSHQPNQLKRPLSFDETTESQYRTALANTLSDAVQHTQIINYLKLVLDQLEWPSKTGPQSFREIQKIFTSAITKDLMKNWTRDDKKNLNQLLRYAQRMHIKRKYPDISLLTPNTSKLSSNHVPNAIVSKTRKNILLTPGTPGSSKEAPIEIL